MNKPTYDPMILSLGYCPFCRHEVTEADYTTELCEPCWRKAVAAPELLEACYKSLADFEDLLRLHGGILDQELALNIHGAHRALKQAIAKAEGGE